MDGCPWMSRDVCLLCGGLAAGREMITGCELFGATALLWLVWGRPIRSPPVVVEAHVLVPNVSRRFHRRGGSQSPAPWRHQGATPSPRPNSSAGKQRRGPSPSRSFFRTVRRRAPSSRWRHPRRQTNTGRYVSADEKLRSNRPSPRHSVRSGPDHRHSQRARPPRNRRPGHWCAAVWLPLKRRGNSQHASELVHYPDELRSGASQRRRRELQRSVGRWRG